MGCGLIVRDDPRRPLRESVDDGVLDQMVFVGLGLGVRLLDMRMLHIPALSLYNHDVLDLQCGLGNKKHAIRNTAWNLGCGQVSFALFPQKRDAKRDLLCLETRWVKKRDF